MKHRVRERPSPGEALRPGEGWPPLFELYEEMARVQGGVTKEGTRDG